MMRLSVFLLIFCIACARPTRANYEKINNDMTYEQVVGLLGEPDDVTSAGAGGFSAKSVNWETDSMIISIQFVNEKVKLKSFSEHQSKE